MIRSGLILMIKDLAGKGKSAYAIGQEIGISKNTARKYMKQADRQHGLKGVSKGAKLDPYRPQLNEWMGQSIFNCVVLLERLRELGYDGGMSILKAYVHPYQPRQHLPYGDMKRPAASKRRWTGASVNIWTKMRSFTK